MLRLRVAACQINNVVGDLDGNVEVILAALERADEAGCDLAVFPELAITGYPPEDLLLKPAFVGDNRAALDKLAARTGRCAAVVGFVDAGRDLYNAAAVCAGGEVKGVYRKRILPNYSVFDEQRYFAPGTGDPQLFVVGGVKVGVSVCEDSWAPDGPIADQAAGGAVARPRGSSRRLRKTGRMSMSVMRSACLNCGARAMTRPSASRTRDAPSKTSSSWPPRRLT